MLNSLSLVQIYYHLALDIFAILYAYIWVKVNQYKAYKTYKEDGSFVSAALSVFNGRHFPAFYPVKLYIYLAGRTYS